VIHPAAVSFELQQLIHTAAGSWITAGDTIAGAFRLLYVIDYAGGSL
jgi:hypothetical protein